jgi:hypothetical protein
MKATTIFTVLLIMAGCIFTGCKKAFEPDSDGHNGEERFDNDPAFAEGLLLNAYVGFLNDYSLDEVATDDAVTNNKTSNFLRMATGEWSSQFDPMTIWGPAYTQIYYINYFLSIADKVVFAWDDRSAPAAARDSMFRSRFRGEAAALRAWYYFEILKRHGGVAADGTPSGFVIIKDVIDRNADWNMPRASYQECVNFILDDINTAIGLLPDKYVNNGTDLNWNAVYGVQNQNRVNALFAKALKSRLLLHVASQTFVTDADKWARAADAAAVLIKANGGVAGLSGTGVSFWTNSADKEILFRRDFRNLNTWEMANFPPSLFGNGNTNPSQNLVDAFPMKNGYPIDNALSGYNADDPYANRDPRLKAYVIYNGNDLGGNVINTTLNSTTKDGLNQTLQSTRTGYYLKKLLIPGVNLNPTVMSTQRHFYTLFRYTEMYLNYAEAANEAWGPDGDPNANGFTARQVIAAIRKRAGINQPDAYLTEAGASKETMRELIRNERRLELSFEGFRFYDMRRWGLALNEHVKGISINNTEYNQIDVENRLYQPFMQFGPVPYAEILRANKTIQNNGW